LHRAALGPITVQHNMKPMTEEARLAYDHLEKSRLKKLGLNETYSRFYLSKPAVSTSSTSASLHPSLSTGRTQTHAGAEIRGTVSVSGTNTLSPFSTMRRPTCGYGFSHDTDNRRHPLDVPAADLTRWRFNFGHREPEPPVQQWLSDPEQCSSVLIVHGTHKLNLHWFGTPSAWMNYFLTSLIGSFYPGSIPIRWSFNACACGSYCMRVVGRSWDSRGWVMCETLYNFNNV